MEIAQEQKDEFKIILTKLAKLFEDTYNKEDAQKLKVEINKFDKNIAIDLWIDLLKSNVPVEKVSENKYEIYDITNVAEDSKDTSGSYIHTVELNSFETTSSIFMKFYFVFYCLANGIKSNEYKITYTSGGWM